MMNAPGPSSTGSIEALLASYPRVRPPLTPAHERIHAAEYKRNRDARGSVVSAAARLERWMHHRVAAGRNLPGPVLELGAGTLNHLPYEPAAQPYDVVEPLSEWVETSPHRSRVRHVWSSLADVPVPATDADRYGRVISIATLEHMTDLPAEIARAAMLMREDGVFQAGIPSEGGFLWWCAWRFVTGTAYYLRNKLDYAVIMRHEHVNTAPEIVRVLRHLFREVRIDRFPLPWRHSSFYTYIEASVPRIDFARAILPGAAASRRPQEQLA